MKGIEVAERFFREWGLPYIQNESPGLVDRVAAGKIFGSDVLGADDQISRDHSWGPQFFLFLSEDDFQEHGIRLAAKMNAEAPRTWKGFRLAGATDKSVHVESIQKFFKEKFALSEFPAGPDAWTKIDESNLYFLKHGALWIDGAGQFSEWRRALSSYPPTVLNRRLAEECFRVWHYGEYNFVQRVSKRQDPLSTAVCVGQFTDAVMCITLLLNDDFTPYWKWLAFAFRRQHEAGRLAPLLESLLASKKTAAQVQLVKEICDMVYQELLRKGVISGADHKSYLLPLLNAYNELKKLNQ